MRISFAHLGLRAGALIVTAALISGCKRDSGPAPEVAVPARTSGEATQPGGQWAPVKRETLRRYTTAVGTLRARQTTRVGAMVSGRVQSVAVDVGRRVRKGDELLRLAPTFFEIEVQQLQSSLAAAQAALAAQEVMVKDAEREKRRQLEVFAQAAGSAKERDDAIAAYDRAIATRDGAKARLSEAEKALQYAQERLRETSVRAPYDGVVTRRMVDPGMSVAVTPATELLELQELATLYLEFSVPQELLSVVKPGARVDFSIEGIETPEGEGEIAIVWPALEESTRSARCRVILNNDDLRLRPGLLTSVRVVEREIQDALTVPRVALKETASGWEVLALANDAPVARTVEIGVMGDESVQVLQGLEEGERVLLRGSGRS